jgi:hypothetical protein
MAGNLRFRPLLARINWESQTAVTLKNGLLALLMFFLAQFLMLGLEQALSKASLRFPAAIIAMFVIFLVCLQIGYCWTGMVRLYVDHLRGPVSNQSRGRGKTMLF